MADLKDVTKALIYLASLYPRFEMAKGTPAAYLTVLCDIPGDILQAAAEQVGANNTFFPAASELRKAAMDLIARSRNELNAEEAWSAVQRAVQEFGWYGESCGAGEWRVPSILDDLTKQAVQAVGGWRALCASEQAGVDRAHFLRIYDGLQRAKRGEASMLPQVREAVNRLADRAGVPRLVGPGEAWKEEEG